VSASLATVVLIAVPAVIATSAGLYYLIERPFQASGKRGSGRLASPVKWWPRNPIAILSVWAVLQFAFLLAVS
jgi:peptidoglycan/LPS O-acetylase OafA/YrhL